MVEIVWTLRADRHFQETFSREEEIEPGAGERLFNEVEKALEMLRRYPELARVYQDPVRRWVLGKRRRTGLFYVPESRGIVVIGLLDLRQSPSVIRRELGLDRD